MNHPPNTVKRHELIWDPSTLTRIHESIPIDCYANKSTKLYSFCAVLNNNKDCLVYYISLERQKKANNLFEVEQYVLNHFAFVLLDFEKKYFAKKKINLSFFNNRGRTVMISKSQTHTE